MRADEANERNHTCWGLRAFPSYQICLLSLAASWLCQNMTHIVFVFIIFFHLPSLFPGLPSVGNLGLGTFLSAIPVTAALGKFLSRIFPLLPPGVAFPSGNNKRETFWCSKSSAARE